MTESARDASPPLRRSAVQRPRSAGDAGGRTKRRSAGRGRTARPRRAALRRSLRSQGDGDDALVVRVDRDNRRGGARRREDRRHGTGTARRLRTVVPIGGGQRRTSPNRQRIPDVPRRRADIQRRTRVCRRRVDRDGHRDQRRDGEDRRHEAQGRLHRRDSTQVRGPSVGSTRGRTSDPVVPDPVVPATRSGSPAASVRLPSCARSPATGSRFPTGWCRAQRRCR